MPDPAAPLGDAPISDEELADMRAYFAAHPPTDHLQRTSIPRRLIARLDAAESLARQLTNDLCDTAGRLDAAESKLAVAEAVIEAAWWVVEQAESEGVPVNRLARLVPLQVIEVLASRLEALDACQPQRHPGPDPLARKCPSCGAPAGMGCVTPNGDWAAMCLVRADAGTPPAASEVKTISDEGTDCRICGYGAGPSGICSDCEVRERLDAAESLARQLTNDLCDTAGRLDAAESKLAVAEAVIEAARRVAEIDKWDKALFDALDETLDAYDAALSTTPEDPNG